MKECCRRTFNSTYRKALEQTVGSIKGASPDSVDCVIKALEYAISVLKEEELLDNVEILDKVEINETS